VLLRLHSLERHSHPTLSPPLFPTGHEPLIAAESTSSASDASMTTTTATTGDQLVSPNGAHHRFEIETPVRTSLATQPITHHRCLSTATIPLSSISLPLTFLTFRLTPGHPADVPFPLDYPGRIPLGHIFLFTPCIGRNTRPCPDSPTRERIRGRRAEPGWACCPAPTKKERKEGAKETLLFY
jgi:hypothetical protein